MSSPWVSLSQGLDFLGLDNAFNNDHLSYVYRKVRFGALKGPLERLHWLLLMVSMLLSNTIALKVNGPIDKINFSQSFMGHDNNTDH